jgi:hypothetical protein
MLMRLIFAAFVLLAGSVRSEQAAAQRVIKDLSEWSDEQCAWLYHQALGECLAQKACTNSPEKLHFTPPAQRGISMLERVLPPRSQAKFYYLCQRACRERKLPTYAEFHISFCDDVPRPKQMRR